MPTDVATCFKIKTKQHRKSVKTLFLNLETKISMKQICRLTGMAILNAPTPLVQWDSYIGELTASIG